MSNAASGQKIIVGPKPGGTWVVQYEDDNVVISEHPDRDAAESDARRHAAEYGHGIVEVYDKTGKVDTQIIEPEHTGDERGGAPGSAMA